MEWVRGGSSTDPTPKEAYGVQNDTNKLEGNKTAAAGEGLLSSLVA